MTPDELAAGRYRRQQRAVRATVAAVMALWRALDEDVDGWTRTLPDAAVAVTVAQTAVTADAQRYVTDVVQAQGASPDPAGALVIPSLAGVASDGRPLDTLLALPAVTAKARIASGLDLRQALAAGGYQLATLVATQVADSGRQATSVAMTAERTVTGYRRRLTPPSCSRCTVLAGKTFRWNDGFLRHPRCDCIHVPWVGSAGDVAGMRAFDPRAYFESLPNAEQDRVFTKAGAQAIRDGADIGQVVNARRGMATTTGYERRVHATTEATTRRGSAAKQMARELDLDFRKVSGQRYRQASVPRLMPEQIYADARDRNDAIRLLKRFGYLD